MSISHSLIDKSVDNRNRALLIRWSKKPENHLALLQLACGLIAFKNAHAARLAHALPGSVLRGAKLAAEPRLRVDGGAGGVERCERRAQ